MPNNFELSLKSIPICTTEMLAIVVEHVANAYTLLCQGKYDEAHVEISVAQYTMIELDLMENMFSNRRDNPLSNVTECAWRRGSE